MQQVTYVLIYQIVEEYTDKGNGIRKANESWCVSKYDNPNEFTKRRETLRNDGINCATGAHFQGLVTFEDGYLKHQGKSVSGAKFQSLFLTPGGENALSVNGQLKTLFNITDDTRIAFQ